MRYLQLVHNEWDPVAGCTKAKVLYNFGRADQLDRDAIARLIASLSRLLEPDQALAAPVDLRFQDSRPIGGAYVLDALGDGSGSTPPWPSCWQADGWTPGRSG